ncbi:MAG: Gfo/Idh/MocA family oxidoreductase [Anaerolineales bacterium]|nr:Gfo/Idh/MocA family oxidoreductase [Anaerolineales bacterium]
MAENIIKTTIIGCGGMAGAHLRRMLRESPGTEIQVVNEPNPANYAAYIDIFNEPEFVDMRHKIPPNEPDLDRLLNNYDLDAAFIVTPHAYHHDQTIACMERGLDVLLEKPMVMTTEEALSLMDVRDRTGRLLVVAFPGSLSPEIREASRMVRDGDIGRLLSISADIWQNWGELSHGTWRQDPPVSGGGFLFDTGAHMLNTVVDLAGEDVVEVAAWMENNGRPVETMAVAMGRLASGALITLHACGETIPTWRSKIHVFGKDAIILTSAWGHFFEIQRAGEEAFTPVEVPDSSGVWEQFLAVRDGEKPNPCPPEVGLRMVRLYDAIKESAARGGGIVKLG